MIRFSAFHSFIPLMSSLRCFLLFITTFIDIHLQLVTAYFLYRFAMLNGILFMYLLVSFLQINHLLSK